MNGISAYHIKLFQHFTQPSSKTTSNVSHKVSPNGNALQFSFIIAQWFGMSQFSKNCTFYFDPFLCFLANYKSWAAHIICFFHIEFDLWYSMVCSKFRYFWLYYMNLLVNGVRLISFFVPLCPAWYFQGVIFSYVGTFSVY